MNRNDIVPEIKVADREYKQKTSKGGGYLIIALIALVFMARMIWAFGGVTNPMTANKVEKRGKEYLEANYPGVYEQVKTPNSGDAYETEDGLWSIHYFSREKNNDMFSKILFSFNLVFDEDLNIVSDGYKDYYLKGGSVYSDHSSQFYTRIHKLVSPAYGSEQLPMEGAFVEKLYDYYFEDIKFYEAGDGHNYTGDYLDPTKEYDNNELAAKYGRVNLKFSVENGTYEDYVEAVKSVVKILNDNNRNYHSLRVYMFFRDADIIFCEADFTKEQIDAGLDSLIENESFVFTRAEYERLKAEGAEMPMVEVGNLSDFVKSLYSGTV